MRERISCTRGSYAPIKQPYMLRSSANFHLVPCALPYSISHLITASPFTSLALIRFFSFSSKLLWGKKTSFPSLLLVILIGGLQSGRYGPQPRKTPPLLPLQSAILPADWSPPLENIEDADDHMVRNCVVHLVSTLLFTRLFCVFLFVFFFGAIDERAHVRI